MKYSFHPEAEWEFNGSIEFYEEKEPGLGYDFAVEIYSIIERILTHPKAWPLIEKYIRRALVKRFPFGILYAREDGDFHHRRHASKSRSRLPEASNLISGGIFNETFILPRNRFTIH